MTPHSTPSTAPLAWPCREHPRRCLPRPAPQVTVRVTARHAPGLAVRALELESVARREGAAAMQAALGPDLGCATVVGAGAHATLALHDNGALARTR